MCGIVVTLNLIRVFIFHAHHSVNPEELDVYLVIKVEVLITAFSKSYGFRLFYSVSLTVWQDLICEVLMNFIDLV